MPDRNPPPGRGHDSVLVCGVAAVVLGVVMVSQGGLHSPSAAHRVSSTRAAQARVERPVSGPDARPVATVFAAERVATAAAPPTANCGTAMHTWACAPRHHLDHDLRLELAAMALQRRRTMHPTAEFVPPHKQDIPASALILAKGSLATPEPSPSAARLPISDLVTKGSVLPILWAGR